MVADLRKAGGKFHAAARQMVPRRWGRIILYGSVSGTVLMAPFPAYTAAKGAVHALVTAMAVELAPYGIRIPAGRLATPEDSAGPPAVGWPGVAPA